MKSNPECVPCLLRQAREAIALSGLETRAAFSLWERAERFMEQTDPCQSPPVMAQQLHRLIRQHSGNPDPYAAMKTRLNERALRLYPEWHRRFLQAWTPLEAAVRMAIVGNLLDVGSKTQLDKTAVLAAFEDALTAPLRGSVELFAGAIRQARQILYLADNTGEIVFDRDLLAQLPPGKCAFAVRGSPVLNDATLADAEAVGIRNICDVIANGSDAPGTLLDDCSPEFREQFHAADLVIAKGQGNFESLNRMDKYIFFLLKIKCDVLRRSLGCPRGSLMLHCSRPTAGGF